jgi:mono/diheme cytochrome c family protein
MVPRAAIRFAAMGGLMLAIVPAANAAGEPPSSALTPEVKQIFATQCSWCHGAWGMKADKGPRLAGTQMTEQQVEDRIRNGKQGYMPAFRKTLSDEEIETMAKYIKSLKPDE